MATAHVLQARSRKKTGSPTACARAQDRSDSALAKVLPLLMKVQKSRYPERRLFYTVVRVERGGFSQLGYVGPSPSAAADHSFRCPLLVAGVDTALS